MAKLVEFKFDRGDWESGFDVSLRISEDGGSPLAGISGQLPPAPNIRPSPHRRSPNPANNRCIGKSDRYARGLMSAPYE